MPAFLAPLALQGLRIGGTAISAALIDILSRLFRSGGRKQIGRAIRGATGARKHLAKRAATTAAGFAGFELLFRALGESPEAEMEAANQNLKGFVDTNVSLSETPDLEQLLAMIGDQPIEDSSGLFL